MKSNNAIFAESLREQLHHHSSEARMAIVWEDEQEKTQCVYYPELYQKALTQTINLQCLAPCFGKGKQGEIRIGVWLPRSADFVTSLLSIWSAGFVYVPISDTSLEHLTADPKFKSDFEYRVRALAPHLDVIITDAARAPTLQALTTVQLINVCTLGQENTAPLMPVYCGPTSEAFVFCSSGTTGSPKMIAIPHEGITDRVQTVLTEMNVTERDCILQYTGFDFDPSVMEILLAMHLGIPLIIAPEYSRMNPQSLQSFFEKLSHEKISLPNFAIIVPSMLKLIQPTVFPNLKNLMTTGENILQKDLAPWFTQHAMLRIFTGYGPTETTWGATLTEIPRDNLLIHITKPMNGIKIKLLPAQNGIQEILIGGNGQGYYIGEHAEEYTQKNWVEIEGRRYFNPHDGVISEDGKLLYSGRIDDHIKYHGKWISLDVIDGIVSDFPDVAHATTVNVLETSLVFLFVVLKRDINIDDLEQDFRRKSGGELFAIFFEIKALKFNARGKRCRQLKEYSDARPLMLPKVQQDPLALRWILALAEIDLLQVQEAFAGVGILDFQQYLPCYSPEDRFDELGGRSIKFPRLVNLLWDHYVQVPNGSQQNFKMGLLRHQSFAEMSLFIKLYQAINRAISKAQINPLLPYLRLQLKINFDIPEAWQVEFCECLESELRITYPVRFYHLIFRGNSQPLFSRLKEYFDGRAVVDKSLLVSASNVVDKYYYQHRIRTVLTHRLPANIPQNHMQSITLELPYVNRLTLLGTACGKTTFLAKIHESLTRSGKVVCYVSCRDLKDEAGNFQHCFGLSQTEWRIFCEGKNILSKIIFLIDDIEVGIIDNRLFHLHNNLDQYLGKSFFIYAGRENFYPYTLQIPERYGHIHTLKPISNVYPAEWFRAEAERNQCSTTSFFMEIQHIIEQFKKHKYIRAECGNSWWSNISIEDLHAHPDRPPFYVTQYPSFSSLVRFLTLNHSLVYSIREEIEPDLVVSLSPFLTQTTINPTASSNCQTPTLALPSHVQYFPGENNLSPWIFFHSISGNCPEEYTAYAEFISAETGQATLIISMPENSSWENLEKQVETYLADIEPFVPADSPYYLLGWSYGGFLAAEATRQLEKKGKTVAVLVNLDAAPLFAYPNFSWGTHTQFIHEHLRHYQNAETLIMRMTSNVRLLRNYCESQEPRSKILAKNYIFAALQQNEYFLGISYELWKQHVLNTVHFKCDSNHFKIFSDPICRTQFLNILERYRDQADLRPLHLRLKEKAQSFLREQDASRKQLDSYIHPELELKIQQEFLERELTPSILVIEGDPGVGKTRLVRHLAETLLRLATDSSWFPIIFSLRFYLGVHNVSTLLALYGLSPSDLRQGVRFLFILDGLDESDLDLERYPINLSDYGNQSKMIITTRKGIKLQYLIWELPIISEKKLKFWVDQFELRQNKSPKYIRKLHDDSDEDKAKEVKKLREIIENADLDLSNATIEYWINKFEGFKKRKIDSDHIRERKPLDLEWIYEPMCEENYRLIRDICSRNNAAWDWLKTPLFLGMLLKLHKAGYDLATLIYNRYELFRTLDQMSFNENCSALALTESQASACYYRYTEAFALQRTVRHDSAWNYPHAHTQAFKKTAQIHEQQGQLQFAHLVWRDYYLARGLIDAVLDFKAPKSIGHRSTILSHIQLIDMPHTNNLLRLLRDFWNHAGWYIQFELRKNLIVITLLSRRFKNDESVKCAARTAMEMLNLFQIHLPGVDLSEIEIPNCDLSGMLFWNSRFQNANLNGVNFSNAELQGANFQGARLEEIECGELPSINGNAFCYSPDGQFFVVAHNGWLIIYDAMKYEEQWKGKCGNNTIHKIVISSSQHIACFTDHECIDVDYTVPEKPTGLCWDFEETEEILDIVFSPLGDELALLYPDGVRLICVAGPEPNTWLSADDTDDDVIRPTYLNKQRLAYPPSGLEIAAIINKKVYVWDTETGSQYVIQQLENSNIVALLYHPNRELLFVSSPAKTHCIDLSNHTVIHEYSHETVSRLPFITVDPTCNQILILYTNMLLRYDIDSTKRESEQFVPRYGVLSANCRQLVGTSSNNICILDLDKPASEKVLGEVYSTPQLAFHPLNHHIVALCENEKIRIWKSNSKTTLQQFRGYEHKRDESVIMPLTSSFYLGKSSDNFSFYRDTIDSFFFYPHNRSVVWEKNTVKSTTPHISVPNQEQQYHCEIADGCLLWNKNIRDIDPVIAIRGFTYVPPDRKKILLLTTDDTDLSDSQLFIVDALTGDKENHFKIYGKPHLSVTADGAFAILLQEKKFIAIDLQKPNSIDIIDLTQTQMNFINFYRYQTQQPQCYFNSKRNLCIAYEANDLLVLNTKKSLANIVSRLHHETNVIKWSYRPNSEELTSLCREGIIYFWDMSSYECIDKKSMTRLFCNLSYSPRGEFLVLWSNNRRQNDSAETAVMEFWDAKSRQCIQQIPLRTFNDGIEWLPTSTINATGNPTYYFSLRSDIYEVGFITTDSLEVNLIWSDSIATSVMLKQPQLIGQIARPIPRESTVQRIPYLNILLKISDYLCYRDYYNFIAAYEISAERCREHQRRPIFEETEWRQYAPVVGEQLQRMGFFALPRPADIHHLKLEPSDYQSVIISEEDGEICGEVDVYLLDDCLRIAKSY